MADLVSLAGHGTPAMDETGAAVPPPDPAQVQRGLDLHERVRATLATIAANAEEAENLRQVPDENINLLRTAGFFRAFQPACYGGLEISVEQYGPILVDIAQACASTAWAAGLLAQHAHGLALMSGEAQAEIWADPETLLSSSVAPLNTATPTQGGVRLSGRFGWSSGCDHAQWAFLGFKMPPKNEAEAPMWCFALVPRSDYAILDDWHVAALRGTGSKTLVLDEIFVPDHRIDSVPALLTGTSKGFGIHDGGIFRSDFNAYFPLGFSAVALGVAKRMVALSRARLLTRVRAYTGANVIENTPAQMRLGEATHMVRAAQSSLERDWREIAGRSRSGVMPSAEETNMWRTNQAHVSRTAIAAVNLLFSAAGGSAWYSNNEMQRLWRDANMVGAHAFSDYDIAAQRMGRGMLGLEPDPSIG